MSLRRIAYIGSAAAAVASWTAPAWSDGLDGKELRILLAGKTIHISAPFGSVPVRYSAGGTMSANSKAMLAFAGSAKDNGTWRISGNQFCQRWNVWYKGKEQRFSVSKTGNRVQWRSNDGYTGTAYASN